MGNNAEWYEVRRMIAERFVVPENQVDMMSDLRRDLMAESLDMLELVVAVGTRFSVEDLREYNIDEFVTAGDLLKLIHPEESSGMDEREYL